jgi:hypothetical protein
MPQTRTHISRKRSLQTPMPDVLWKAGEQPDIVQVPARTVLALDGQGEPEGARFQRSVNAIFGVSYALKFARKAKALDFRVAPLEARWWVDEPDQSLVTAPRAHWRWQLRAAVPADLTDTELAEAVAEVRRKKADSDEAGRIHIVAVPPQRVGRALHIGPYRDEARTFAAIGAALAEHQIQPLPRHMEIYLGDPRRAAPDKLRTVICVETKT